MRCDGGAGPTAKADVDSAAVGAAGGGELGVELEVEVEDEAEGGVEEAERMGRAG